MSKIPESVLQAWDERVDATILTTVDKSGNPNSIYATCVGLYDEKRFVIADNYFMKTRANIKSGSKGALLFITKAGKSYQVKGTFSYETQGDIFDFMKVWNPEKHPGHAAAVLIPLEIYSGSESIFSLII